MKTTYPLLQSQLSMFVIWQQNPTLTQYNNAYVHKFNSRIDVDKLKHAIICLLNRRPELYTRFEYVNDEIRQYSHTEDAIQIEIRKFDAEEELRAYYSEINRPFDLLNEHLSRFSIVSLPDADYLLTNMHHIIYDGWSHRTIMDDINNLYMGRSCDVVKKNIYQCAINEQEILSSDEYDAAASYYTAKFEGAESLKLDLDSSVVEGDSIRVSRFIDRNAIDRLCEKRGIRQNNLFMSAFSYVLSIITRNKKFVIGTINHGRYEDDVENVCGMMVRTVPILADVNSELSITDFIATFKQQSKDNIINRAFPYTHFVSKLSLNPTIIYSFNGEVVSNGKYDNESMGGGFSIDILPKEATSNDLGMRIYQDDKKYEIRVDSSNTLHSIDFLEMIANCTSQCVENMIEDIDAKLSTVSLLSEKQKIDMINLSKAEDLVFDRTKTVIHAMLESASKMPENKAVVDECSQISYRELSKFSNGLADKLIELGVQYEDFVALMLPRRKEFIISTMAVMRAGAAYVPFDLEYPIDRLEYMLQDSRAKIMITTREIYEQKTKEGDFSAQHVVFIEELDLNANIDKSINNAKPEGLAYMIYTSGSTGKPKGVMIEHRSLHLFNEWACEIYNLEPTSKEAAFNSFSFDGSMTSLTPIFYRGGALYILNETVRHDMVAMFDYFKQNKITSSSMSTQFGMEFINQYGEALPLKYIGLGGEKMLPMKKTNCKIINFYGPTEFTVTSVFHVVDQNRQDIPIGRPTPCNYALVVDANGNLLPYGVPGELCLAGEQISRGYWQREEKTLASFVNCQFLDMKMYKTGDLVKWNKNDELEYLGRIDTQVKLRGYRIELGEIESKILAYGGISSAAAEVKIISGAQQLCAYITANETIDPEELKNYLAVSLAAYMVPSEIMQLDVMPLTPNGKIDRKKLPLPELRRTSQFVAPRNPLEAKICEIYANLLQLKEVGVKDNYFEIGGNSISAIRVNIELNKLGYEINYGDLFNYKTPEKIAEFLSGDVQSNESYNEHFDIESYDYTAINTLLTKAKDLDLWKDGLADENKLNSVLLTGATGYLGMHLLNELVQSNVKKIYCLVRPTSKVSASERLKSHFSYYFNMGFEPFDNKQIEVIQGDITDDNLNEKLGNIEFDTVINPAAMVKHFIADDSMDRVNIQGVRNLIDICKIRKSRLVQISTYSVAGLVDPKNLNNTLHESDLYIGQQIENEYILGKYKAERYVLQAIADGEIKGKVMRVGNLMAREKDGEFQANIHANAFINRLKSYKVLGAFPIEQTPTPVEFSPIDKVSEAIVKLSATPDALVVFHPYNNYKFDMAFLVRAMKEFGFKLDLVSNDEFSKRVTEMLKDESKSIYLQGIMHKAVIENNLKRALVNNDFTSIVLLRLGCHWNITDINNLKNMLENITSLGYFEI